ncbi:thiosulfate dehydrogenase [quinone] large subunit [Paractinoplanes brasiliensis]|uniref:Thiosulfate dehydrogenase [quinone] large subunit n=1 Tax=Paractinoplanes brasiliensis TaxID=52695 RepID=A0A4R6JSJ8_9ACTN|nr:DoxX family membrane protein [Actinoplanes brasiliensis]TDO37956.1 thiosulfate dehydrogenase [quinone] large subunit [Actinoplanes brasiliensis]GID31047.1 membrane protein [Actinoplanes brasiliensis]
MTTIHRAAAHLETVEAPGAMLTKTAARALAALRITTGFVFLWAFLDKTFGLGYSTPWERAWINGGSPTKGFLSNVEVGPFQGFFHSIAGAGWANWSFMLGMLAIGVALIAGVGLRLAAVGTTALMALMWAAEWPLASGSSNPVVDYHFIYAVVAVVVALTYAGHTWGLGRLWAKLPLVQKNRWLI